MAPASGDTLKKLTTAAAIISQNTSIPSRPAMATPPFDCATTQTKPAITATITRKCTASFPFAFVATFMKGDL